MQLSQLEFSNWNLNGIWCLLNAVYHGYVRHFLDSHVSSVLF